VKHIQKQWLGPVPWETVLNVNQTLCQAQKTEPQAKDKSFEAARQLWEKAVPKAMSLPEVLEVCRRCQDLGPFVFNNGNTFASISTTLVEDWTRALPAVEAQILRTTVSHYVAGQVGKKELLQVLRHVETRWMPEVAGQGVAPSPAQPQAHPTASLSVRSAE
jgi:hypothetical protein